jgi:hypothetical protein
VGNLVAKKHGSGVAGRAARFLMNCKILRMSE